MIVTFLLVCVNIGMAWASRNRQLAALKAQITEESLRADGVRRLDEKLTAVEASYRAFEMARRHSRVTQVLNDLARTIPDKSWLTEIDISAGHMTISGYSSNAALLIPSLSSLAYMADVRFDAPVTTVPGDLVEHFSIRCFIDSPIQVEEESHG